MLILDLQWLIFAVLLTLVGGALSAFWLGRKIKGWPDLSDSGKTGLVVEQAPFGLLLLEEPHTCGYALHTLNGFSAWHRIGAACRRRPGPISSMQTAGRRAKERPLSAATNLLAPGAVVHDLCLWCSQEQSGLRRLQCRERTMIFVFQLTELAFPGGM